MLLGMGLVRGDTAHSVPFGDMTESDGEVRYEFGRPENGSANAPSPKKTAGDWRIESLPVHLAASGVSSLRAVGSPV